MADSSSTSSEGASARPESGRVWRRIAYCVLVGTWLVSFLVSLRGAISTARGAPDFILLPLGGCAFLLIGIVVVIVSRRAALPLFALVLGLGAGGALESMGRSRVEDFCQAYLASLRGDRVFATEHSAPDVVFHLPPSIDSSALRCNAEVFFDLWEVDVLEAGRRVAELLISATETLRGVAFRVDYASLDASQFLGTTSDPCAELPDLEPPLRFARRLCLEGHPREGLALLA